MGRVHALDPKVRFKERCSKSPARSRFCRVAKVNTPVGGYFGKGQKRKALAPADVVSRLKPKAGSTGDPVFVGNRREG